MLESRYREIKQCEFCGLRTDHVDEILGSAFIANVNRAATTCMNCYDEQHLRWCARTALGTAIATAAQAAMLAARYGWERVNCQWCGRCVPETRIKQHWEGWWLCEDSEDCDAHATASFKERERVRKEAAK